MSTLKVDNLLNAAGNESPISVPGAAKAWVNFNGTGTVAIRDSFNVGSITDNGTGDYSINFTNNMSNTNYAFAGNGSLENANAADARIVTGQTRATSSLRINTTYSNGAGGYDTPGINVVVFGD
jgi:hypothetical protein